MKGLSLRVYKSGTMGWTFRYSFAGKQERVSLGVIPTTDPDTIKASHEAARKTAIDMIAGATRGADPKELLKRGHSGLTVADLCRQAVAAIDMRPATRAGWEGHIKRDIDGSSIGGIPANRLTRDRIQAWGDSIRKRSGFSANRAFEVVRRAYSYALDEGILEATPFVRLKRPFRDERPRSRVLTPDELGQILQALERLPCGYSDATALMLYTGCRKTATIGAHAREFDLAAQLWTIPAARQKSRREHIVPLSAPAVAIIQRNIDPGHHLFPAMRSDAKRPFAWIGSKWLTRLQREAGVGGWTFHTFRHTLATWAVDHDFSDVAGPLLDHPMDIPGVTRRYAHSAQLRRKKAALDAWADFLRTSCGLKGGNKAPSDASTTSPQNQPEMGLKAPAE